MIADYCNCERLILEYVDKSFRMFFRESGGQINYKFIVPGACYPQELWDWDSWLTDVALGDITTDDISEYEKGCVLNFLEHIRPDGWMPIDITPVKCMPPFDESDVVPGHKTNTHKPCLAQHALYVSEKLNDFSWLDGYFDKFEKYIGFYFENCFHAPTGLYFWLDDCAIGVDNDPCAFYRPDGSCASIYLNSLMYRELLALSALAAHLDAEKSDFYAKKAETLGNAIRENCWDERNGFFYSVDINLKPITKNFLHSGAPRHWNGLIQRIDVWTGFMPLWAGIATPEQAKRVVEENYRNEKTFNCNGGIRTLSKLEKMYRVQPSGNPSCWLGPVWGISNYMVFKGLLDYGYFDDAVSICEKTIKLFADDIAKNGAMHEYYDPDTCEGVNNLGFQSWNLLVAGMVKWYSENVIK